MKRFIGFKHPKNMTTMDNKLLAERVWEEIWHQGDLSRMEALFTSDYVRHDPGGRELYGMDQNRQFISSLRAAFPDLHFSIADQIAEGDKIVIRYRFQGTNLGAFQGRPPTHKPITYTGILIYRIVNGKIAEQWTEFDFFGLLRQLGILATPPAA